MRQSVKIKNVSKKSIRKTKTKSIRKTRTKSKRKTRTKYIRKTRSKSKRKTRRNRKRKLKGGALTDDDIELTDDDIEKLSRIFELVFVENNTDDQIVSVYESLEETFTPRLLELGKKSEYDSIIEKIQNIKQEPSEKVQILIRQIVKLFPPDEQEVIFRTTIQNYNTLLLE